MIMEYGKHKCQKYICNARPRCACKTPRKTRTQWCAKTNENPALTCKVEKKTRLCICVRSIQKTHKKTGYTVPVWLFSEGPSMKARMAKALLVTKALLINNNGIWEAQMPEVYKQCTSRKIAYEHVAIFVSVPFQLMCSPHYWIESVISEKIQLNTPLFIQSKGEPQQPWIKNMMQRTSNDINEVAVVVGELVKVVALVILIVE